jgi:hypothetical protein
MLTNTPFSVASTALPLVLHIIDVKLSSYNKNSSSALSNPQEVAKQNRLNILIEAMKTYQPQYDGVDYVSETIRHIVTLAQLDTPAPPSASNTISDWTDILASQPGCYLRLAMTMDLSLSKGRLPEESDFPASLRGLFTAGYSSIKALMGSDKRAAPRAAPLLQHQNAAVYDFGNQAINNQVHHHATTVPGTVHSLSSDADTDSPGSLDDHATAHRTLFHDNTHDENGGDIHMADGFIGAALEMEGLAGEVLAAYSMQNDSSQSSGSDLDVFEDDGQGVEDWIGTAWENEVDMGARDNNDQDTAMALLSALREGEGVDCGA